MTLSVRARHSIRMYISIIRNIYERDWHTPYSKRPKKWRCGWGMKYVKGGVLPGKVDYEPEIGEEIIPLSDNIWESLEQLRQAHRRRMWAELEQVLGRPLTGQDRYVVETVLEEWARGFDEYMARVLGVEDVNAFMADISESEDE